MTQSKRPGGAGHGLHDCMLCRPRRARGRHVDGLFEERTVQWVGFVEDREDLERPFGQYAFDRILAAGYEGLDQHGVVSRFTLHGDLGALEQTADTRDRVLELSLIVGTNYTLTT